MAKKKTRTRRPPLLSSTKKKNQNSALTWVKRVILGVFVLGVISVVGFTALFLVAYWKLDVPNPNKVAQAQMTTVYYADGKTPMGTFAERNRQIIDTTKLPDYVKHAVVASEDRTFYENSGVDLKAIIRALWNNIRGNPTQGASTLTQQYVENYYVGSTTSYVGKFKETILALKINREQPKDKIIDNYLNTIYFGRGAYGIEAAAEAYFDKPASKLTLSESALLSGIIPAPSAWDPYTNPEQAKLRWQRVLNIMREDKWIKDADVKDIEFPKVIKPKPRSSDFVGSKGYLLQHVRDELKSRAGYEYEDMDTMGLKIVTTIDPKQQQRVENAANILPSSKPKNLRVGIVSINPQTGGIVAEYGGSDFTKIQSSAAYQDIAMAGSTFKPFTLVAGLEQGISLDTRFSGQAPIIVNGEKVGNYGGASYGNITIEQALMRSVNTSFIRLNEQVGPENSRQVAIRAGYPEDTLGLNNETLNVLGTSSPHTVNIAEAFATFANEGVHIKSHIVAEVKDANGHTVYKPDTRGVRVFQKNVVAHLCKAMHSVATGPASGIGHFNRPVATKTGSSEDNRSAQFVGFVPQLATAVSLYQVGENGNEESITPFGGVREVTGGTWPAKIWENYMRAATAGMKVVDFPKPDGKFGKKQPEYKYQDYDTVTRPKPQPKITLKPFEPLPPTPDENENQQPEQGEGVPPDGNNQ